MQNFVQGDRTQPYLLPPDLREWLPADDLAHFVVAAVERVPLSEFRVNTRGTGSAQYHPAGDAGVADIQLCERYFFFSPD